MCVCVLNMRYYPSLFFIKKYKQRKQYHVLRAGLAQGRVLSIPKSKSIR